jgi:hypothetical protein
VYSSKGDSFFQHELTDQYRGVEDGIVPSRSSEIHASSDSDFVVPQEIYGFGDRLSIAAFDEKSQRYDRKTGINF